MKLALSGIALGALTALAGCGGTTGSANPSVSAVPTATSSSSEAASSSSVPPTPEPTPTPTPAPSVLALGQAFTWEDGVSVIVLSAKAATLHASYAPAPGLIVTVQIKNGTGKALDPFVSVNVTSGAAGEPAQGDADSDLGALGIQAPVPPGGVVTAKWAFSKVVDANVLSISVQPGFTYEAAFWKKG